MGQNMVSFNGVTWTYAGSKTPAIENINLKLERGKALLITGPAGSGKTTICRCINGLIPHFFPGKLQGNVIIDEKFETAEHEIVDLSKIVGMTFQDPSSQLLQPTVIDDVSFALENYGVPRDEIESRVEKALEVTGLKGFELRNPHTLSGGEQQLCAIAYLVALEPDIFVMDEPTANLDPLGGEMIVNLIKKLLKEKNKTFIIVSHLLEDMLPLVDEMIVLDGGKIVLSGEPKKVLGDYENVEKMKEIGVNLPQVTLLIHELQSRSFITKTQPALTIEDAHKVLSQRSALLRRSRKHVDLSINLETSNEASVNIRDLWHIYRGGVAALRGVNLKIYSGDFLAVIGQNGSGKTTLAKHLNGLLKPTRGEVFIDGVDTREVDTSILSRKVGYVFQNPDTQIFNLSVEQEVAFGLKRLNIGKNEIKKRVNEALNMVNLSHAREMSPFQLSLGERQRIALASILVMEPDILVVDEPTTGQDYKMKLEIMNLLKRINNEGKTVIIITHDMDIVAKYVEKCVLMWKGEILCYGPTRNVFAEHELLEKTRLRPPQIFRLSRMMGEYAANMLTVEEYVDVITEADG